MLLHQPQQLENENQQQQNIPAPQRSLSLEPLIWRPPPVSQVPRKASLSSRTDLEGKQRSSSYADRTELELRVCHLEITHTELQLTASHLETQEQDVDSYKSKHHRTNMEPVISHPSASTKEPEGGLFRHPVKSELDQNLCQEQVTANPERLLPETDFRPALSRHVSLETEPVPCRPLLPQNSRTELDPSLSHLRNSLKELETFLRQSVPYPENRETPSNHTKHRRISSCVSRTPTKEASIPSQEVLDAASIPLGRIASLPPCSVSAHRSADQEQSPDHLSWTNGFESHRIQDIKTTPERRQDRHPPLSRQQAATARHESIFRERCRTVSPAPQSTKVPDRRDFRSPARQSLIVSAPRVARLTAWQQEADRPPRPLSLASDLASPTWRDVSPRRLDEMGRLPSAFFPERDATSVRTNGWSLSPDQLQGGLVSECCISESTINNCMDQISLKTTQTLNVLFTGV
jgi:hypothetical protein